MRKRIRNTVREKDIRRKREEFKRSKRVSLKIRWWEEKTRIEVVRQTDRQIDR